MEMVMREKDLRTQRDRRGEETTDNIGYSMKKRVNTEMKQLKREDARK